jgi:hypothetical protein
MRPQFTGPLSYSANCFLVVKNIPYRKAGDYYDFVIIKVVTQLAGSQKHIIASALEDIFSSMDPELR